MFIDSLQTEEGRERNICQCDRETSIGCLSFVPPLGIEPLTYVCALTGDGTHNLVVYRKMLQPSHPASTGITILKCRSSDRLEDIPVQPINFSGNSPHGQGPSLISQKFSALANDVSTWKLNRAGLRAVPSVPRTLLYFQAALPQLFKVTTTNIRISF